MYVRDLTLTDFRNYSALKTELSPDLNLIFGKNAQGKTNFLEALYLLCLGRSFRAAQNQDLVKTAKESFIIQGTIATDNEIERSVGIKYIRDGKKEISVDRKRLPSHSAIFGHFPIVVMAPDEFRITTSGPSERRRFVDLLLSQVSLSYLSDLQSYNRTLKQRNRILHDLRDGVSVDDAAIEPWSQKLVDSGTRIIKSRERFLRDFSVLLNSVYATLTDTREQLTVVVESTVPFDEEQQIEAHFHEKLKQNSRKERILGNTLVGPHRDDVLFTVHDLDLRKYGSRGEHKSVLIAMKIAEFNYLRDARAETPVLLLDDCYSELDESRERSVFASLTGLGQIFLTSPKQTLLENHPELYGHEISKFNVDGGTIERFN